MYDKSSPETIQNMFSSIAQQYDRANIVISLGLYGIWNQALVKKINHPSKINALLDLCAGTGEIAFAHLQKSLNPRKAYLLDFCGPMLEVAKIKAKKRSLLHHDIQYIEGDAQKIPLPDNSVDGATIAYGIRNVADPAKCAAEVLRVLRPGGRWGILELTRPKNPLLRTIHNGYLKGILPVLGKIAASNKDAYQYLSRSIGKFLSPEELLAILKDIGFSKATSYPQAGGIATIIIAEK
jgi:demethylmenaquinone methyltransferase / 2-methoxy-6-polyprenyl-1,4-benzoquinol methylase